MEVPVSCLVGFIGDFLLQCGVNLGLGGPTGWGLKEYFIQHGPAESLFIAGGMQSLFYIIYFYILKGPRSYLFLGIYGIILDLLFRIFKIFPSLNGYYNYFNYFSAGFWEAFSMILPLFIINLNNMYN